MNVQARLADGLERRRFSLAEFERMGELGLIGEDERIELLDGELVPMAAKGNRHEGIKAAINLYWGERCPKGFAFAPETALRLDEWTYLEPDFIVFSRATKLADVKGPDVLLAVEVADSSLDYDLNRKPLIYARFGVPELWVVDAARRAVHVHRDPGAEGYASVAEVDAATRLEPIRAPRELSFALDDLQPV